MKNQFTSVKIVFHISGPRESPRAVVEFSGPSRALLNALKYFPAEADAKPAGLLLCARAVLHDATDHQRRAFVSWVADAVGVAESDQIAIGGAGDGGVSPILIAHIPGSAFVRNNHPLSVCYSASEARFFTQAEARDTQERLPSLRFYRLSDVVKLLDGRRVSRGAPELSGLKTIRW